MLQEELKKLLIKQRILFVILFLLLIQAGYIGFRSMYSPSVTKVAEKNEKIYDKFSSLLNGRWDNSKDTQLDEWLLERDKCVTEYNTLVNQLLEGEISEEILYTYYKKTPFCQNQYTEVLDELEEQRSYIKQNVQQRYMMKVNGWVYFFEDHFIYYLYFLFLTVLFIPLFIRERETQMDLLQGLSTKGKGKIFNYKILASIMIMCAGLVLLYGEKYLFYWGRCGLKNIRYPIQSVPVFEKCPWEISLGIGILTEVLLLLCAGYLLGGVIIFCSMLISKIIEVCLLVIILVFVPMFVISEEMLFRYPVLPSILFPSKLVYGWRNYMGEQVYKTQKELLFLGGIVILIGTILLLLSRKRGQKL